MSLHCHIRVKRLDIHMKWLLMPHYRNFSKKLLSSVIYGNIHFISNCFVKNTLKFAQRSLCCELHFNKIFIIVSVLILPTMYRKIIEKIIHIVTRILYRTSICVLNSTFPACRQTSVEVFLLLIKGWTILWRADFLAFYPLERRKSLRSGFALCPQ